MVSATARPSASLHSSLPVRRFHVARGYAALDPRPRASPRFAVFTRNVDTRFCGSDCRPTTSATTSRRTDTPTSIRFPLASKRRITQSPRMRPRYRRSFLGSGDLPLSKKDHESCEPRQSFRRRPYDAASAPQSTIPKATGQSRRRLRATPRLDHRLRRWPLDDSAGLHGPGRSERGTLPPAACCRRTTRVKIPLLI
jgi:hypothetical protein